ncbi:MAG TPA: hypothetical protein VN923_09975, partial [Thermoanaerobaculia bacterium]|nr:hypothetical protein [Thermoanaerobaculia bacterium]
MTALRVYAAATAVLLAVPTTLRGEVEQEIHGVVSLRALAVSGGDSWVDGGIGKLRFDEDDEPLSFGAAHVAYRARLTPILALRAAASAYADGPGSLVDLDEAYLELRPVPRSAWRLVARGGA